ncbi:MAG: fibronectin type III domain-containing protein [Flavobacteriales bacterium]|nr:fibronectin type III domain-containing protein [Flavobacteriales bacterium]
MTGLNPGQNVDIYIQSNCGSGDLSLWSSPINIQTPCGIAIAPYFDNFDTGIPCWTQDQNDVFDWTLNSGGTPSSGTGPSDDLSFGGDYIYIETSSPRVQGDRAILYSPNIDISALASPQLRFFTHMFGSNIDSLIIDLTDDGGLTYNNIFIKNGNQVNQWVEESILLSNYSDTIQFKITGTRGSSWAGDISIDNFQIIEAPTCPKPTALSASNITATSSDFSWTPVGTETAWNIEIGTTGFAQGSGTTSVVNTPAISFSSLSPFSSYDVYVQADCGGDVSAWFGPVSFTTSGPGDCSSSLTYSYTDNSTITSSLKGFVANNPGDYITLTFTGGSTENCCDNWYINDAADGSGNTIASGAGFITSSSSGGIFESSTGEISFYVLSDGSVTGNPFVFSASCVAAPTCPEPTGLTASNITTNSADITWTPGGTETAWNLEFGPSGFSQGTGTNISVANNPHTLSGLNPSSNYDIYIQADCGSGDLSNWTGPYSFSTSCGIDLSPYFENFDSGLSQCWIQETSDQFDWSINSGTTPSTPTGPSDDITGGGNYLYIETSSPRTPGDSAIINSNFIDISNLSNPELSFSYHMFGASIGELSIWITDATGLSNQIFIKNGDQGDQWNFEFIDLSSYSGIVQFSIIGAVGDDGTGVQYWGDIAIDNFKVAEIPISGTWKLATIPGALKVGPNFNDGSWWSSSLMNLFDRSCHFDDSITFSPNGDYIHHMNGSTFIENWQDGQGDRCDVPVYPHDGSVPATWTYDATTSQVTLNGLGAHMGLPKVNNSGEISDPANAVSSITYDISFSPNRDTMYSDINFGPGWWRYIYVKNSLCSPIIYTDVVSSACSNYTWPLSGNTYTVSNNSDIIETSNGQGACNDSIVLLDLTIDYPSSGTDTITACDSYTWINGSTYIFSNNTATHTITNAAGCDSVVTLDLTINYSTTGTDVITACDNYTWIDGITYTSSNNSAMHTLTNAIGCDSVVTLDLTINYSTAGTDAITACDNYTWIDGVTYTSSNNAATHTLTNAVGCDSIVTLDLTINYSTTGTDVISVCDSYTWIDGVTYTSSNFNAKDTLTNAVGCDSVVSLNLSVQYSTSSLSTVASCNSYTWNGMMLFSNGIYVSTSTNSSGCVQTDSLDLTITTSSTTVNDTVCDSYSWNGNTFSTSGTYYNPNGSCVDTLNLVVNYSTSTYLSTISCDEYVWNGNAITGTGLYLNTSTNSDGCPQYDSLDLVVNNSTFGTDVITACDSYTWIDGITYTSTNNTAQDTLVNAVGCDSIVTLDLRMYYTNYGTDVIAVCDSLTWIDGITYTSSNNTATDTLMNIDGCDSIVTLDLTINYSIATNDSLVVCDVANWNGNLYTTTGIYVDTLQTIHGCDSIVTMDLVVNYSIATNDSLVVCDSALWNGNTYTTTGTYVDILQTIHGCDSVVTMDLVVNYSIATNDSLVVCDSALWNGNNYTTTGIYVDTLQTIHGCDSVVTMDLVVNYSASSIDTVIACYEYLWNGNNYTTTGIYLDTLQTIYGCDSLATLDLTVVDLSVSIDTAQLTLVANIIGGMGPFNYTWNTGETVATITPTANGQYWLVVVDINGCSSDTVFFDVTYLPNVGIVDNGKPMIINVYPNPTLGNVTIDIVNQQTDVQITLYDMYGKLVYLNKYQDSKLIEFSFDAPPGIYYLDIKSGERSSRHKIINL